jgi:ABC-type amino acid transport substrate-binding protein
MHSALAFDERPEPLPRSGLMELTVGVQLAAPWAWMRDGVLGGIEVEDARAFAKWLGRPIRFEILEPDQIAQALEDAEIDIAIGGIRGDRHLTGVALSCRYSARKFGHGEERHGSRLSHVWAMPRRAASLFATLAFYLWMIRPGVPELEAVRLH